MDADTRIGDGPALRAYLDAYAAAHPEYAAWQARHWVGDVDGWRCPADGTLTANNGARRLCPVCGAIYPRDPAPPGYQQGALFGEEPT